MQGGRAPAPEAPGALRFSTVLFDLDGTLTDSGEGITRCIQHAYRRLGLEPPPPESLRPWIGPPLRESFARGLVDPTPARLEAAIGFYRDRYATTGILECRVYDGIPELLHELRERGARLRLCTCKPEPYARRILERLELARLFDGVFAATLDGTFDRKEEILAAAVADLDRERRKSAAMVGDRGEDVSAARGLGITAIAVGHGFGMAAELLDAAPDHTVADTRELARLLLGD